MKSSNLLCSLLLILLLLSCSLRWSYAKNKWPGLVIQQLCTDFYVYTTYGDPGNGEPFPANGMYVVNDDGVVMLDSPWDSTQFDALLDSIERRHHKKVVACIATHFHEDRTAGLTHYKHLGIATYTSTQTDALCLQKMHPRAAFLIKNDSTFYLKNHAFETFYPGKGHSPDNIVIWFEKEQILYGGCFIKSCETQQIGNLSDASLADWQKSLKAVQAKYPHCKYIIPGHQDWNCKDAIEHSLSIIKKELKKQR